MEERVEALRALMQDPASNLAAVGTIIAIVVVLVVIVVLALIAFALPSGRQRQLAATDSAGSSGDGPRGVVRRHGWLGCLGASTVLIAGAIASALVWYDTTSTNEYCSGTCHAMLEPAASHARSAHAQITCVRCHEGRPWTSIGEAVGSRSYSLYLQVTGARPRTNAFSEKTCADCHRSALEQELVGRNGEPFRHTDVLNGEASCLGCHENQGHTPSRR